MGGLLLAAVWLFAADARIVDAKRVDRNADRIDDTFATRLAAGTARKTADGRLALIVSFREPPSRSLVASLESAPAVVRHVWSDLVYAAAIEARPEALPALLRDPRIALVAEDAEVVPMGYIPSGQIGARRVWSAGVDGDKQSIAVLDTGVDDSHTDLTSAVIAWRDETGVYATPTDEHGHGTQIASIAAGRGLVAPILSGVGTVPFSDVGTLPGTAGGEVRHSFPLDTRGGGGSVSGRIRWACTTCSRTIRVELEDPAGSTLALTSGAMNGGQPLTTSWAAPGSIFSTNHKITASWTGMGGPNPSGTNYWSQVTSVFSAFGDGQPLLAGAAKSSWIVGVKVLNDTGGGTLSNLVNGLSWVASNKSMHGISVAILAVGLGSVDTTIDTAVDNLVSQGVVVVVVAGNSRPDPDKCVKSPGTASKAITVAAISPTDAVTDYSSIGCSGTNVLKPDLAAPGGSAAAFQAHVAADSNDQEAGVATDQFPNDYVWGTVGTSYAGATVAGAAALMASSLPSWAFTESYALRLKALLLATATETNAAAEAPPNPTLDRGGKDVSEGYGRVNVDAAIDALRYTMNPGEAIGGTFGPGPYGVKAWARTVWLEEGQSYSFFLDPAETTLNAPDLDLYLYADAWSTTGASIGDPVLVASSTSPGLGVPEQIVDFQPLPAAMGSGFAPMRRHFLVAKAVFVEDDEPFVVSMIGPTAAPVAEEANAAWESRTVRVRWRSPPLATTWRVLHASDAGGPFEREIARGPVAVESARGEALDAEPGRTPWYVVETLGDGWRTRTEPFAPGAREGGARCAAGSSADPSAAALPAGLGVAVLLGLVRIRRRRAG